MKTHATVLVDKDGIIQFWSDGAARMFGYSSLEIVGRPVDVIVPEELRAAHWSGFRTAMARGSTAGDGTPSDIPVLCRDKGIRAFRVQVRLVQADQMVIGALAVFSHVSTFAASGVA
jgi:PAS domain S-box-containing protein